VNDDGELREGWEQPHPRRLPPGHARYETIVERHADAMAAGMANYADPISGLRVFTAGFLAKRGYCCDSGCRHCPFVSAT
jgi:hypothetical protein